MKSLKAPTLATFIVKDIVHYLYRAESRDVRILLTPTFTLEENNVSVGPYFLRHSVHLKIFVFILIFSFYIPIDPNVFSF